MPQPSSSSKKNVIIRADELRALKEACNIDVSRRQQMYEKYRSYYYEGSWGEDSAVRRLYGEINTIASLIYTPEKIVIDVVIKDVELNPVERGLFDKLVSLLKSDFYTFNRLDEVTKDIVLDSLICGTAVAKVYWDSLSQSFMIKEVLPENFGVAYATLPLDHTSQIVCHKSFLPKRTVEHRYGVRVAASKAGGTPAPASRGIVIPVPNNFASVQNTLDVSERSTYFVKEEPDLIDVYELWLNDTDWGGDGDWLKYMFVKDELISRTPERYHKLRHPFYFVTPFSSVNSVWGYSIIELLKKIQDKRNETYELIDKVTGLLAEPPIAAIGMNVSYEQIKKDIQELCTPNGVLPLQDPNGRIEQLPPKADIAALHAKLDRYDNQVKYLTGLTEVVMGESMRGVRSAGHAGLLAAFASAPLRGKSNTIESQLEEMFTHGAYLYVMNYKNKVQVGDKKLFLSAIPYDFKLEIRSFTSSPLEMRETVTLAEKLTMAKLMPIEVFLDIAGLPYSEKVKEFIKNQAALQALKTEKEPEEGGEK